MNSHFIAAQLDQDPHPHGDILRGPVDGPAGPGVVARFDEHALGTPDSPAVSYGGQELSYAALQAVSAQIAAALRAEAGGSARSDEPRLVPVVCERGLHTPAAFLGVVRSGMAYVPVDPQYPEHRVRAMLEGSGAQLCVVDRAHSERIAALGLKPIVLEDMVEAARAGATVDDFPASYDPDSLVYVIYTSGSTGKPKGVMVRHGGLDNLVASFARDLQSRPGDRVLSVTTPSFDIFALELFVPLCSGATVVVASREDTLSGKRLGALLERERVDVMQATPAGWRVLLESGWKGKRDLHALVGGEALPPALARELVSRTGTLLNVYGPTETTIWSTCWQVPENFEAISIGWPIGKTQLLIVDESLQPVPRGTMGELLIGGDGVAAGYHGREDLTQERFIEHPLLGYAYRTGDLARVGDDGLVYFHGRADHQVKIRGFRIELGDVESALAEVPGVGNAAVVVSGDDERKSLVAFVAPAEGCQLERAEILDVLRNQLPGYMVPSQIVVRDALPLTPNRKVDRTKLSEFAASTPSADAHAANDQDISETHQRVARAMQSVLGGPLPRLDDDFFDLGGHSLLVVQLVTVIQEHCGVQLDPVDVFRQRTVARIAELVEAGPGLATSCDMPATVERLRDGDVGATVVFVGSTAQGAALARAFRQARSVIGLNLFGTFDSLKGHPQDSVSAGALADTFVRHLRQVVPEGPYALCGYCDDAKIAWEIADRLEASGQRVSYVAAIDPEWLVELYGERPGRLSRALHALKGHGPDYLLRKVVDAVRGRARALRFRRKETASSSRVGSEPDVIERHPDLYAAYMRAMDRWSGPSRERDCFTYFSSDWQLNEPAISQRPEIEWRTVRGIHSRMFQSPTVDVLAGLIEADLDAATP